MSVWDKYTLEERKEYIKFLQIYGALTNLFRQKQGEPIPYLDSKFQETIFARVFKSENVDIGNTPHDVLSILSGERIGIGLKTWIGSKPSFQKVMQLKRYQKELEEYENSPEELAIRISKIKNEKMIRDYKRLGLSENKNIYHYVTRDEGKFTLHECTYPLVDINNLSEIEKTETSLLWHDGQKSYKYTFGDCQIWQKFDSQRSDTVILASFDVNIIADPFDFLLNSYMELVGAKEYQADIVEVYLPLYSYRSKTVEVASGLNAWNAKPKSKNSNTLRPLNEIYIPIPKEFHNRYPDFFCKNISPYLKNGEKEHEEIRFKLVLPNGKTIPALLTQSNRKGLQSGSLTEVDPDTNKYYGQSALGQWLLLDVLGLEKREPVTMEWLHYKGTDSVRLWHKKDDYETIYIDFAPIGAFEDFMNKISS